jgi:hypothetical protein
VVFLFDGTAVEAVEGVNSQTPHLDISLLPLLYSLWYSEAVTIRLTNEDRVTEADVQSEEYEICNEPDDPEQAPKVFPLEMVNVSYT